jgi:hypothetical protein
VLALYFPTITVGTLRLAGDREIGEAYGSSTSAENGAASGKTTRQELETAAGDSPYFEARAAVILEFFAACNPGAAVQALW